MASSNWCTETDGKVNYTKLCRLLVDGGTQAVRSVFDGIHPPSSLKAILNANKTTLQTLKKPRGKVLNNDQWDKLYPASASDPKSEDFDITLLFVLLRNICGLTPPATGWDVLPPGTDTSQEANLARIKYFRNNTVAHKPNTEINDADFEQHWQDISSALLSLGLSQDDIDDLKSDPLGKKDYKRLLHDWYMSDEDIKTQLEDVRSKAEDIKSDTAEIKEKLDDIKNVCSEAKEKDQAVNKLAISDFGSEISTKCKSFHPNTRQWILDQVKSHVDSDQPESCIMLITAGPGMGKSTIAAKVCQTYKDLGYLAGCHFFQFSNSLRNNPRLMLQSIARQMCDTVPGYREALESKLQTNLGKNISEMNCEELLTILLEETLWRVKQTDTNFIVVLDALDECTHDSKVELLKALRKKLSCFPSWLRFIVTSRPSTNTSALGLPVVVEIRPEAQSNIKDLRLFFSFTVKALYPQYGDDNAADLVQKLVCMTKGLFLVAFFAIEFLKRENVTSPEKVLKTFPNGISSVYENYFSRLKELLLPYIPKEEKFYKMLEAVVATNDPLPKNMFYNILCLKSEGEVPRQERKTRKDALNALLWMFPVVGNYVTVFHKSVVDWLTLEGEEQHDFSVRVEDGSEVLISQCNDVLSDIQNGEKDLDKPLDVTYSEKYALKFLCHLAKKRSMIVKDDKYGLFSSIYILIALKIKVFDFDLIFLIRCGHLSFSLIHVLDSMTDCYPIHSFPHYPTCHLFHRTSFGRYLAFVLQAAHAEGISDLDALKKFDFPYFEEKTLFETPSVVMEGPKQEVVAKLLYSLQYVLECKEGFIAVLPMSRQNSLSTAVHVYQRDGCLVTQKDFLGIWLIATSPNIRFIVAAEENGKKIEILDVTTLEVVSQYEFPHDAIKTCHVFGDNLGYFIVIKGHHDNKVYVFEGLAGRVRNTITVVERSTVVDVSCQGHVVEKRILHSKMTLTNKGRHTLETMIRNCKCYVEVAKKSEKKLTTFEKKDGEVELMNWKRTKTASSPEVYRPPNCIQSKRGIGSCPSISSQTPTYDQGKPRKEYKYYQELFLYHREPRHKPIPIYPLVGKACHCPYRLHQGVGVDKAIHFSEDGCLLAYHYKDSIFIVNTSDGSLFKRWSFARNVWGSRLDIIFVSKSYLVVIDGRIMSVINVKTDEIEHKIYLPHPVTPNQKQYLLLPEEDGKSFNLISSTSHRKSFNYKVSRLVFHNLNLQGLR